MQNSTAKKHSWTTLQDKDTFSDSMENEVHAGLNHEQKRLPPKFFYDKRGSELFDAITELPEYYPTRTELHILQQNIKDIANMLGEGSFLLELGSGSSLKIRLLLEAARPRRYVPMDISREHLIDSTRQLARDYPWLDVYAAHVDYSKPWVNLNFGSGRYNIFFPGSSIGNFEPESALQLLKRIREQVGDNGGLLIGVDLKKDVTKLEAAYNDASGITAQFNLNILLHINEQLDADFDINNFAHQAHYNADKGRIEMHLKSLEDQSVNIDGNVYAFKQGETIHTENSYKYSIEDFRDMAKEAGFEQKKVWVDDESLFSVQYFEVSS